MKNVFLLCLLALLSIGVYSQTYPVVLCGTVSDTAGNGVAFHDVNIKFDSVQTGGLLWSYNATVTTDANGNYCDTIQVPNSITQGGWTVCTLDCDNITVLDLRGFFFPNPTGNTYTGLDFILCNNSLPNCYAYYSSMANNLAVTFTDGSVGSTAISSWSWDFGDGNSSTSANPTHTYASAGIYSVCVTILTASGCTDTYCSSVAVTNGGGQGPFSISGFLIDSARNTPIFSATFCGAEVYLIEYDAVNGTLTAVDSTIVDTIQNGAMCQYNFSNVPAGDYLIKGALLPSNPDYANVMPTYYQQDLFWSGATTVTVNQNLNSLDVWMIYGTNPGGPGFVGGLVSQGANKTQGPGDPVEHAQVMVLNMDDSPVQYTYTDANGEYSFSNLAYGTYKIYTESIGKTTDPIIVTLSPANPSITGQNIVVNSTDIAASIYVPEPFSGISVYPNPTAGASILEVNLDHQGSLNLSVTDLTGRLINQESFNLRSGANKIDFDISNQEAGLYFLNIEMDGKREVKKIVVN